MDGDGKINNQALKGFSPRVFIVHEPVRWDRNAQRMVRLDMSNAEPHGELNIIFPGADRPKQIEKMLPKLACAMSGFREQDCLALVGDWDVVVWAAVLAAKATKGKVNLLKWNNRDMLYDLIRAPDGLWEDGDIPVNIP